MEKVNSSNRTNNSVRLFSFRNEIHLIKNLFLSRYSNRQRVCCSIPIIYFEFILPVLSVGIILLFSHYLFNNENFNENEQRTFSKNFFGLNENEKCSDDPQKYFFNETKNEPKNEENCLKIFDERIFDKSSKINLYLRFLNRSNSNEEFILKFIDEINNQLKLNHCISMKVNQFLLWKDLSKQDQDEDSILFNQTNHFNLILDVKQLNMKLFEYDLIVQMPKLKFFERKLKLKIDHSYLSRHEHPAEQIVKERMGDVN